MSPSWSVAEEQGILALISFSTAISLQVPVATGPASHSPGAAGVLEVQVARAPSPKVEQLLCGWPYDALSCS